MPEGGPGTTYTVAVDGGKAGLRLDRVLADALPDLSRTRIKALIGEGRVAVVGGDAVRDAARKVRAGERYRICVPAAAPAKPEPQAIPLAIVYEDDDLIVVDKPAGLVVHPAAGNPDRTLVNALLAHAAGRLSGIGGVARPGIVHRLDKGTSGLMVVAKNDRAHRALALQFARHTVERAYRAVVWGVPSPRAGEVGGSIGRAARDRKRMAVRAEGGKPALTRYRVLGVFGSWASLVECRLATGRTHQVRVHMAAIGHGIVGDPVYGRAGRTRLAAAPPAARRACEAMTRQALHAYLIGFIHPTSGERLRFVSDDPIEIKALIESI